MQWAVLRIVSFKSGIPGPARTCGCYGEWTHGFFNEELVYTCTPPGGIAVATAYYLPHRQPASFRRLRRSLWQPPQMENSFIFCYCGVCGVPTIWALSCAAAYSAGGAIAGW